MAKNYQNGKCQIWIRQIQEEKKWKWQNYQYKKEENEIQKMTVEKAVEKI